MKAIELRAKSTEELKTLLSNSKKELFNLRFQKRTGELENTSRIRAVRRNVARIHTILPEVESGKLAAPAKATKKTAKETSKAKVAKKEKTETKKAKAEKPAKKAKKDK